MQVRMAHRARQRVRGMVGLWVVIEMEQRANHIGDLRLIGGARANNGLLDLHRGVLPHLDPAQGARDESSAAGMGGGYGGTNIRAEIDTLHSRLLRAIAIDHGGELVGDAPQARRQVRAGRGLDATVCPATHLAATLLDDAPPGASQTRVDPQYDQSVSLISRTFVLLYHACGREEKRF